MGSAKAHVGLRYKCIDFYKLTYNVFELLYFSVMSTLIKIREECSKGQKNLLAAYVQLYYLTSRHPCFECMHLLDICLAGLLRSCLSCDVCLSARSRDYLVLNVYTSISVITFP